MRAAQIEDGVVVNYAEVSGFDGSQFVDPLDSVIGATWDGTKFTAPPPPPPVVPQEVSRRRGLQAIFKMYRLTEADIEAHITDAVTNADEQYLALTEFRTSQTFERNRALVVMMGHMLDLDLDALFIMAAQLP